MRRKGRREGEEGRGGGKGRREGEEGRGGGKRKRKGRNEGRSSR